MTLSWIIEQMWVKPTEGTYTDVVVTANWRCNSVETVGTGDDAKTYYGTAYGSCSFAPPTGSFTPYLDLQPEQVLDWCHQNGVDKTAIEANVSLQINNQINPPVVSLPLPWVAPVPPAPNEGGTEPTAPVVAAEEAPVVAPEIVADQPIVSDAPAA